MPIQVAIVEDDYNFNAALQKIISNDAALQCCGNYYKGFDAFDMLPKTGADVVIVDIHLPDMNGIELVKKLFPLMRQTKFMMCTSFDDDELIFNAMKAGAGGYLVKGESMDKIIRSIVDVYNGGAPLSYTVAGKVLNHFRDAEKQSQKVLQLTTTEKEVLEMLAHGMLYKEIAEKKFVTLDTIKKHTGNIYRKLQVGNKTEAINIFNNSKN